MNKDKDIYSFNYFNHTSDLSEVGRVRYAAFDNIGAIETNANQEFLDKYDRQANSTTCLIRNKEENLATIRACVYSQHFNFLPIPCLEMYGEELADYINSPNKTIVESTRFAILPNAKDSRRLFKLQFRFIILNALKFNADYVITAVRSNHVFFYKKLKMYPISNPKKYFGVNFQTVLLYGDCKKDLREVMQQDPLFDIGQDEVDKYLNDD